ncbi:MAG TPA: molybdopterin-binding protein [Candidatus Limnocylindrales bacterium]|nr:molybdopterin-binding protein [Candidatus Limnocylindrales bacterium]
MPDVPSLPHPVQRAELVAIGTELTVGETIDTNSGELARSLVAHGVSVSRVSNLPDDLPVVVEALRAALTRADLVVTTGGLGPTPDDLTREAVAELCGEEVEVDPATLAWLEALWARRGQPFPSVNVKQAWRIPSATMLPNPNGTAPGWYVEQPDGRVIVTLPGPPREMRPMWHDEVLPRLAARGVGGDSEVRTLRLTGVGESVVAERLGETLLRATNPVVATYARHEAVDVRISARPSDVRSAAELADEAEAAVLAVLGDHVWARGDTTWAGALEATLRDRGWTLATTERGTDGALVHLLRGLPAVLLAERRSGPGDAAVDTSGEAHDGETEEREAERIRRESGADVGLAIRALPGGEDTVVHVGVVTPEAVHAERRFAFLRGSLGADRAAIAGAAALLAVLRGTAGR